MACARLQDSPAMGRILDTSYALLRPILFSIDAERSHRLTLQTLSRIPSIAPRPDPPELHSTVFGVSFSNPLGLAAGADKDARAIAAWNSLGFGFAEIGTITPRPQRGNAPPRMWRLTDHRALINRLGFPSEGMDTVARRLEAARRQPLRIRLAVNLGPNKDTPADRVAADYAALMTRVADVADFVVVNLSSPNTPGLRAFQAPERIRAIVETLRAIPQARRPLLIKDRTRPRITNDPRDLRRGNRTRPRRYRRDQHDAQARRGRGCVGARRRPQRRAAQGARPRGHRANLQ